MKYINLLLYIAVYFSLNGSVIPNHGYVVISDIGTAGDDTALLCHTNRPPPTGSSHSGGDWFAPDGYIVRPYRVGFRRNQGPMVVKLFRRFFDGQVEGIYYCQILEATETLQTIYVGLYNDGRGNNLCTAAYNKCVLVVFIEGGVTVNNDSVSLTVVSDPIGASPQFTLTCISTGGPATTVTWTRDSVTVTEGTETVLNDTVTAEYTHTLNVTSREGGLYTCTVANNKPSNDSASITVEGNAYIRSLLRVLYIYTCMQMCTIKYSLTVFYLYLQWLLLL